MRAGEMLEAGDLFVGWAVDAKAGIDGYAVRDSTGQILSPVVATRKRARAALRRLARRRGLEVIVTDPLALYAE